MNYSRKSTYPLFESICVLDGQVQNEAYHVARFAKTYQKMFLKPPEYNLFRGIVVPEQYEKGKAKLRIAYGKKDKKVQWGHYQPKMVKTLKLIFDDTIEYSMKYKDRTVIEKLFAQRAHCDDILIIKNQKITDTSYANIIFFDGSQWITPTSFLLNGTKRQQLIDANQLIEEQIKVMDIFRFKGFQLINAMLAFDPEHVISIENIKN